MREKLEQGSRSFAAHLVPTAAPEDFLSAVGHGADSPYSGSSSG